MTNEEAIEILKHEHDYAQLLSYVNEALKMAISALEKQILKKPNIHGYREGREINTISYTCPICNKHISRDNYCKNCGNAIDWSDSE